MASGAFGFRSKGDRDLQSRNFQGRNTEGVTMNGSSSFNTHLTVLEARNWERWSAAMKNMFGAQDWLEIMQNGVTYLATNATEVQRNVHKDLKKKDCKALFLIQQSLDEGNFERISKSTSSKEAWDILAKYHEGDDKVKLIKLQSLRRNFELKRWRRIKILLNTSPNLSIL